MTDKKTKEFGKFLIKRAGLTDEMIDKGRSDPEFEYIMQALSYIHRGKEVLYGNYMETHANEPENFSIMSHFLDLKRKYVRAENFVKLKVDGQEIDLDELIDTYSDLAVYSVMGLQVLKKFKLENEGKRK